MNEIRIRMVRVLFYWRYKNMSLHFYSPQFQASHSKTSADSTYLILGCGNTPSVAQPPHFIALMSMWRALVHSTQKLLMVVIPWKVDGCSHCSFKCKCWLSRSHSFCLNRSLNCWKSGVGYNRPAGRWMCRTRWWTYSKLIYSDVLRMLQWC